MHDPYAYQQRQTLGGDRSFEFPSRTGDTNADIQTSQSPLGGPVYSQRPYTLSEPAPPTGGPYDLHPEHAVAAFGVGPGGLSRAHGHGHGHGHDFELNLDLEREREREERAWREERERERERERLGAMGVEPRQLHSNTNTPTLPLPPPAKRARVKGSSSSGGGTGTAVSGSGSGSVAATAGSASSREAGPVSRRGKGKAGSLPTYAEGHHAMEFDYHHGGHGHGELTLTQERFSHTIVGGSGSGSSLGTGAGSGSGGIGSGTGSGAGSSSVLGSGLTISSAVDPSLLVGTHGDTGPGPGSASQSDRSDRTLGKSKAIVTQGSSVPPSGTELTNWFPRSQGGAGPGTEGTSASAVASSSTSATTPAAPKEKVPRTKIDVACDFCRSKYIALIIFFTFFVPPLFSPSLLPYPWKGRTTYRISPIRTYIFPSTLRSTQQPPVMP